MKIVNKFDVGNKVFYISNGQLHVGVIDSVSITQRIDSDEVTYYTFTGNYAPYKECYVFSTIEDATHFFLAEVNEN